MTNNDLIPVSAGPRQRFGCLQVTGLLVVAVLGTALVTAWATKAYFFPSEFEPVALSAQEERLLTAKLRSFERPDIGVDSHGGPDKGAPPRADEYDEHGALKPEAYSEAGARREIRLTERELNALLAKNTDLAKKLAIDLSDNLVSAKLLLPLDEDLPVLGGRTLRVKTGVVIAYEGGKPMVVLKGLTIMGVPIPNAWLGGLKNIDLVEEFGTEEGFWQSFSEGIAAMAVEDGRLKIVLKE